MYCSQLEPSAPRRMLTMPEAFSIPVAFVITGCLLYTGRSHVSNLKKDAIRNEKTLKEPFLL